MTEQQTNIENFMVTVENNLGTTLAAKAAALPDGFQPAKFQQNCVAMLKTLKKADLVKIKPQDIVACLMKAALLDLDFSTGECYALPYWNKEEGKNDLNFQTDYKGEKKVAETYSISRLIIPFAATSITITTFLWAEKKYQNTDTNYITAVMN